MSVKDQLALLEQHLATAKAEEVQLSAGKQVAATRLRNALLQCGKIVSESRKLALDQGKSIVPKKRAPKEQKSESKESKSEDEMLPEDPPVLERQDAEVPKAKRGRKPKSPAAA